MGWAITDYNVVRLSSEPSPAAGGTVSITCAVVPTGYVWLVSGITVMCPSSETVPCVLYDQDPTGNPVPCSATRLGNLDIADQASPILITGGNQLILEWTGVDEGVIAKARIQYAVAQRPTTLAQPVAS